MNVLGPVLAAVVATGTFYVITHIRLRRRLDADAYREHTAERLAAAPWRRHLNVVVDADGSYTYTAPRPQRKGGGSDEARLGVVTSGSLAGGKGSTSGLPHKAIRRRCSCGESDGHHTGQCFVVSYTNPAGETIS